MPSAEVMDDPIWEYVLNTKLQEYIAPVREFWKRISTIEITGTGVFQVTDKQIPGTIPPGLMYRVTNTPVRSPIKNVQVFPFVPVAYLQITNVSGGANKMVSRVCADNKFKIEEFTIVEKSNLPSTYHKGQFIAFVPTNMLGNADMLGKWVYLTMPEIAALSQGKVPTSVRYKVNKYIN